MENNSTFPNVENAYKMFFEELNDSLILIELGTSKEHCRLVKANKSALSLLGFSEAELAMIDPCEIFYPKAIQDRAEIFSVLHESGYAIYQTEMLSKADFLITVEISARFLACCGHQYILSSIRDVSERKRMNDMLKESEERYRSLVENSPYAIIVYDQQEILFMNEAALKTVGFDNKRDFIGHNAFSFVHPDERKIAMERFRLMVQDKKNVPIIEERLRLPDGREIETEIMASGILFQGKPAVQSIIHDVTEDKIRLRKAMQLKRQWQGKSSLFPLEDKAELFIIDKPSNIIGGDLYHFHKKSENQVIGFLGDVNGKGIIAALNNSAISVIFHEAVSFLNDPKEILEYMNKSIGEYMQEEYVAACCFTFDFSLGQLIVAGAGINWFDFAGNGICKQYIVTGPFLGMFPEAEFDRVEVSFQQDDVFYFYTDGLEPVYQGKIDILGYHNMKQPASIQKYIEKLLGEGMLDDSTWIAVKIDMNNNKTEALKWNEEVLFGLEDYSKVIDDLLTDYKMEDIYFDLGLALTEALTNAYFHGNNSDPGKPIFLRSAFTGEEINFEVQDCGEGMSQGILMTEINENNVLQEKGRGMYLIRSLADSVDIEGNKLRFTFRISGSDY